MSGSLLVWAPDGVPEVAAGDDLVTVLLAALAGEDFALADGDVVVVTSKVVSKAEGRVVRVDREEAITSETVRLVARRGPTRIVETRHGFVLAAAGVDATGTEPGSVLLLPVDPDASARALRSRLLEVAGVGVAVLVTDTMGRAWRTARSTRPSASPASPRWTTCAAATTGTATSCRSPSRRWPTRWHRRRTW